MKSKTKNLIAIVPLTIAALATTVTVVYLYSTADPASSKPGAHSGTSPQLQEIGNPSTMAPSSSSDEAAAKPRNAAERLAYSLSSEQHGRLLALLNGGTSKELLKIHGVGKTRAEAIQAARPFETVADLAKVNGVGEITFASVIEHGKRLGDEESVVAVAPSSMR